LTSPDFELAVVVPIASSADVAPAIRQFVVPEGLNARLFLLDTTIDGSIGSIDHATVVRGRSFVLGDALAALAEVIGNAPVVLRRIDALYDSDQLQAVVDHFAQNPNVEFLTCNVSLSTGDGIRHVVDPARDGTRPPQCWDAGLALRASALSQVGRNAWFPSLLAAYIAALQENRAGHLDAAYAVVSYDSFAATRFSHYADLHLLHTHQEAFGSDTPWLSVVVHSKASFDAVTSTLSALFGQVLPPGTFEVILVDRGDGTLNAQLENLSFSQPSQLLATPGATCGAALQAGVDAARGQVLLFVDDHTLPFPDLAELHIRAHRDRPGQLLAVMGSLEHSLESLGTPLARAIAGESETAWVLDREAVPLKPAHQLRPGNFSLLRDAVLSAGGFKAARDAAAVEDLGWQLHNQGYEVLAVPDARSRVAANLDIDAWQSAVEVLEADRVALHADSAKALDASGHQDLTAEGLEALLAAHGDSIRPVRAALEGFASGPHMYALENLGGDWAELTSEIERRASSLLTHLRRIAEANGRLNGLRALGKASYAEVLRTQKLPLPGARGTRYLLRPVHNDETGWLSAMARFLVGFGPMDDTTLVVFADSENGGIAAEEARSAVLELTKRITPGLNGGWADVQVAEASGTPGELIRLVGTVDGWTPTGHEGDQMVEALAEECGTPAVITEDWLLRATNGVEPWPIVTRARFRLLVWPDWSSEEEMRTLFDALARPLANREDAALVLRYDMNRDGDPEVNLPRMAEAFDAVLGEGHGLEVVLLDDDGDEDDFLERLSAAVQAVGVLPSSANGDRKDLIDAIDSPKVTDMMSVTTQLFSLAPLPLGPLYVPTLSLY